MEWPEARSKRALGAESTTLSVTREATGAPRESGPDLRLPDLLVPLLSSLSSLHPGLRWALVNGLVPSSPTWNFLLHILNTQ